MPAGVGEPGAAAAVLDPSVVPVSLVALRAKSSSWSSLPSHAATSGRLSGKASGRQNLFSKGPPSVHRLASVLPHDENLPPSIG